MSKMQDKKMECNQTITMEYNSSQADLIEFLARRKYHGRINDAVNDYAQNYARLFREDWFQNPEGRTTILRRFRDKMLETIVKEV